jgi:2-[(L-alanin-3-ylcarbamoyl)methyl]-2-hydroxybutanedioate decarboxylase
MKLKRTSAICGNVKMELIEKIKTISNTPYFHRTPNFYIYNIRTLNSQLKLINTHFPSNFNLYYSMKSNPHHKLLNIISRHKSCHGLEVASAGELMTALKFVNPKKICFTGPAKTQFELNLALDKNVGLIIIESLVEAKKLNELAKQKNKKVSILVRVNTNYKLKNVSSHMSGESTKFGIEENVIEQSVLKIKKEFTQLNIQGFHFYGATGVLNYKELYLHSKKVLEVLKKIEFKTKIKAKIIDLGGGFGVDYTYKKRTFNISKYFSLLKLEIARLNLKDRQFIFELGRYVVANCGYYCAEIIDIKHSKGKYYILVSGGVNHLNRPNVTGENQPVFIIRMHKKANKNLPRIKNKIVDICGPLCFAEDKIGKNIKILNAEIGDIVVVEKAGSYGLSGSPMKFISHNEPKEFFWTEK